jgi:hypothetical protein
MVEAVVVHLSRRRHIVAPLALAVGAVAMLFEGLRLLLSNWRLTLVQVLPAMWIWAAMLDLKLHVLHGASFRVIRGPVLIPIMAGVVPSPRPASSSMPCSRSPSPGPARRRSGRRSPRPGPMPGWCSAGARAGDERDGAMTSARAAARCLVQKFALCKNPLRLLPVLPAPTVRAGP